MKARITGALCWCVTGLLAAAEPAPPDTVPVPAGTFIAGSDRAEREAAYRLDEQAYGHDITRRRRWYESELQRHEARLDAYRIMQVPVTNADYARFVADTGHPAPDIDRETWAGYGLIHPYSSTRRFAWKDNHPPAGREQHPVTLVSHADARAYAEWLAEKTGQDWRLPTEAEWEKAARGTDGRRFPWGNEYNPALLNSADRGPSDTMSVGSFPDGASPFGMLDAAGQVYEWTATLQGENHAIVKGGGWDDQGCGVCRPAARHARPVGIHHILIGFRLVVDAEVKVLDE